MARCDHLEASGFYHTALDSLMDSLFISSTPNLEIRGHCHSRTKKTQNLLSPEEDQFFSICNTSKQCSYTRKNPESNETTSSQPEKEVTPKRTIAGTRKQKLFDEPHSEEYKPRTRTSSGSCKRDLSPQTQLLKKAMTRMECLQRRQERIELSKKPIRTSLRV